MPDRAGADSLTARPVARVVLRKRLNEALSGGVPVLAVVPFTTNSRVAAGKRWDSAAQFGPSARFENLGGAPSLSLRCLPSSQGRSEDRRKRCLTVQEKAII